MTLNQVVQQELYRMIARQLDYAPAADELQFTCQVMVDDLVRHGFTEADSERVRVSFIRLGPTLNRWPTARMVIDAVPDKPRPKELPAPKADPERVAQHLGRIGKHKATRSVYLPGESFADYTQARADSGLSVAAFEAKRLIENGWTAEDERKFRAAAHVCRLGTLPGATPEDIALMSDPDAIAERQAIQEE